MPVPLSEVISRCIVVICVMRGHRSCLCTYSGGIVLPRQVKRFLNTRVRVLACFLCLHPLTLEVKASLDEKETLTMPLLLNSQSEGSIHVAAVLNSDWIMLGVFR